MAKGRIDSNEYEDVDKLMEEVRRRNEERKLIESFDPSIQFKRSGVRLIISMLIPVAVLLAVQTCLGNRTEQPPQPASNAVQQNSPEQPKTPPAPQRIQNKGLKIEWI